MKIPLRMINQLNLGDSCAESSTGSQEVVFADAMERESAERLRARLLDMIAENERIRRTHVPPATLLP